MQVPKEDRKFDGIRKCGQNQMIYFMFFQVMEILTK
jgi:hypothetical protein